MKFSADRVGTAPRLGRRFFSALLRRMAFVAGALAYLVPAAGADRLPLMERAQEIALALSSCPPSVARGTAVYVLEAAGYVKVRESQNGFTAIVQHSLPTSQEPQCMDAEGTRTLLPRMLKVAELRAQGKSREDIQRIVADAFAKGIFRPPSRTGINYMLSTENRVPGPTGAIEPFPPHVMFYAPYLMNADIGSEGASGPAGHHSGYGEGGGLPGVR
jgi:hypothetical protein